MKMVKTFLILCVVGLAGLFGWYIWRQIAQPVRFVRVVEWLRNAEAHLDWAVSANQRCGDAPFSIPTDGYIGFLWDDSFRPGHRHQGLDIFGGQASGATPVYAAYDGYLTREPDWKSSLITRVPSDPLQPGRQIWLYYTHLADKDGQSFIARDFPPVQRQVEIGRGVQRVVNLQFVGVAPALIFYNGKMQVHADRVVGRAGVISLVAQQCARFNEHLACAGRKIPLDIGLPVFVR